MNSSGRRKLKRQSDAEVCELTAARSDAESARAELQRVRADARCRIALLEQELKTNVTAARAGANAAVDAATNAAMTALASMQQRAGELDAANEIIRVLRSQLAIERSANDEIRRSLADQIKAVGEIQVKLATIEPGDKLRRRLAEKSKTIASLQSQLCAAKSYQLGLLP